MKKQILVIINQEITRMTKRSQVIYETRYSRRILQSMYQERKEMKNDLSNKIWTLWVSDYVIWIDKHISNILRANQSCVVWSSRQVCYSISRWYTDILWQWEESWKTCQESLEKTSGKESLSEIEKMWIS